MDATPRERAITEGMMSIYREFTGDSPVEGTTVIHEKVVTCILAGSTSGRGTSLGAVDRATAAKFRKAIQAAMASQMTELIESVIESRVQCVLSSQATESHHAAEVFVLAPSTGRSRPLI